MTHKLKIYLDTSVINFLYADDAPQYQNDTIDFFENYARFGVYETYISRYVIDELMNNPNESQRNQLLQVVEDYDLQVIDTDANEIAQLALLYISAGVIPPKKLYDALHVAVSIFHHLDYLVSWNFKHLANVNRESRLNAVNLQNGYTQQIRIITPSQLLNVNENE